MNESERRKILLRLVVPEDEIFTCPKCGRRFYIDTLVEPHDSGAIREAKGDEGFRNNTACGDCHPDKFFWDGERYLDEG